MGLTITKMRKTMNEQARKEKRNSVLDKLRLIYLLELSGHVN